MSISSIKAARRITELKLQVFSFNGHHGTEMLYLLNGEPACSRTWSVLNQEAARMWLENLPR